MGVVLWKKIIRLMSPKLNGLIRCVLRIYRKFLMFTEIQCQNGSKSGLFVIGNCLREGGKLQYMSSPINLVSKQKAELT